MKLHFTKKLFVLFFFIQAGLQAQQLDLTFDPKLKSIATVNAIARQSDGKFIIAGDFTLINGQKQQRITRINADGTPDNSFSIASGPNNPVTCLAIQTDGKVLVGGSFNFFNGLSYNRIVRLNTNGSIDNTFNVGSAANSTIFSIVIQADNKILIGGFFTTFKGSLVNRIARLNTDGNVDNTFTIGTAANSAVSAIALQSDGKVLIAGSFSFINGNAANRLARLNANGTFDNTLSIGAGANFPIRALAVQADGKILAGGTFTSFNAATTGRIVRLESTGAVDQSFQTGTGFSNTVSTIIAQSDGSIFVGGIFRNFNALSALFVVRLLSNGSRDNAFTSTHTSAVNQAVLSGTNYMLASSMIPSESKKQNLFASLSATGAANLLSALAVENKGTVNDMKVLADGKILITGNFVRYDTSLMNQIGRLNADGSMDNTFNQNGMGIDGQLFSAAFQSNGKILIGGTIKSYNGTIVNNMARLNANGTFDNTFIRPTADTSLVRQVMELSTGKPLIVTSFTSSNGATSTNINRLNTDGTLDNTWSTATSKPDSLVMSMTELADGKILVSGSFTNISGSPSKGIARLNANGGRDTSFSPAIATSTYFNAVTIQPDGKILASGIFTFANDTIKNRIIRFNADGSLDNTFLPGAGTNNNVNSFSVLADGKILIAGAFTTYNRNQRSYVARINSNGSLDNDFVFPAFAEGNALNTLKVQTDGNILLGGNLMYVDDRLSLGLTRFSPATIEKPGTLTATVVSQVSVVLNWIDNTNYETGFKIERSTNASNGFVEIASAAANTTSYTDNSVAGSQTYFYKVRTGILGGRSTPSNTASVTTLEKIAQTITFPEMGDKMEGDAAFTLNATANSTLPLQYVVNSGPATVSGNTVTLTGAGRATIRAVQNGNEMYKPAENVIRQFCVNPAKPLITVSSSVEGFNVLTVNQTSGIIWYRDNKEIVDAIANTYVVRQEGSYSVKYTISNCSNNSDPLVVAGEEENILNLNIKSYPNPGSVYLSIEMATIQNSIPETYIYDYSGALIQEKRMEKRETLYKTEMDISTWAKGMYFLKIKQGNAVYVKKFIKE